MKGVTLHCLLILAFLLSCTGQTEDGSCPHGTDCTQIKADTPEASSGVYLIQPAGVQTPFPVYCEMREDGGWTVFQRRSGGDVSFSRKWREYDEGFGNFTQDHWLGLSKVSSLTGDEDKEWTMRVDLRDHDDATAFAEYSNFRVGGASTAFKLHVGKFRGDAGDAIRGAYPGINQTGFGFSTIDRDNDGCSPCRFGDILQLACASSEGGGWWFSRCGSANLNGDWHAAGQHIGWASGLHWRTWKSNAPYSMKGSRMMIKSV